MATQPFQWFNGQKITSPEQAARQRSIAEALIAQSATPATNWSSGLADVAAALSGTVLQGRVDEAEAAGRERAGGLFADLALSSSPDSVIAALTSPDAAWASPAQTSIASALLNQGLERSDPMYQLQLQTAQAELDNLLNGTGGTSETFFAPIAGTINGEPTYVQFGNQGSVQSPTGLPEGFTPQSRLEKVDLGNEWLITDTTTGQSQRIPKDNYTPAYDAASGSSDAKTDAENKALYASMASKLPGLKAVVGELNDLASVATYTRSGQIFDALGKELGQDTGDGALARSKYIAMVDNQVLPLLRDTFGAAFTVQEGESLRATLGNPNASPREKQAILEAFIEQKERDIAALGSLLPGASQQPATPASSNVDDILKGYGL